MTSTFSSLSGLMVQSCEAQLTTGTNAPDEYAVIPSPLINGNYTSASLKEEV